MTKKIAKYIIMSMDALKCPSCGAKMKRNGTTKAGTPRWRCKACGASATHTYNSDAKQLKKFLGWLLSKKTQAEMPGGGRSFRRMAERFWGLWALPPLVDEIHPVVFIDAIYIARNARVLIACSESHVLGWYLARSEHSKAWGALMSRIAPPGLVVTDGAPGFEKARKRWWPDTVVQRCTIHAFRQVKKYTTTKPKLPAGVELYALALELMRLKTIKEADEWVARYLGWCERWSDFLEERTYGERGWDYTHWRLRKARSSLSRLVSTGSVFTYLTSEQAKERELPATNNQIESLNAQIRHVLRNHRGLSTMRRVKAAFWWCYMHTECPASEAKIIKMMPTDEDIEAIYQELAIDEKRFDSIPQWGDALVWSEFHHSDPWRHDWD